MQSIRIGSGTFQWKNILTIFSNGKRSKVNQRWRDWLALVETNRKRWTERENRTTLQQSGEKKARCRQHQGFPASMPGRRAWLIRNAHGRLGCVGASLFGWCCFTFGFRLEKNTPTWREGDVAVDVWWYLKIFQQPPTIGFKINKTVGGLRGFFFGSREGGKRAVGVRSNRLPKYFSMNFNRKLTKPSPPSLLIQSDSAVHK